MLPSNLSISRCEGTSYAKWIIRSFRELEEETLIAESFIAADWIILPSLMCFGPTNQDFTSTQKLSRVLRDVDEPSLSPNESSALKRKQTPGTDVLSAPTCANAT